MYNVISITGRIWEWSLVMWAGEGVEMSWWALGGVRVQVGGGGCVFGSR